MQSIVDSQEISPADIDRMNSERDNLAKQMESLTAKQEALNNAIWEKEIGVQKGIDSVEQSVAQYNSCLYSMAVLDSDLKSMRLELRLQGLEVVPSVNELKATLSQLRKNYSSGVHGLLNDAQDTLEKRERLSEAMSEKVEELKEMEQGVKKSNNSYGKEKQRMLDEATNAANEIARNDEFCVGVRGENNALLKASNEDLEETELYYEGLVTEVSREREDKIKSVVKTLEEIIAFKSKVSALLGEFRDAVDVEEESTLALEGEIAGDDLTVGLESLKLN